MITNLTLFDVATFSEEVIIKPTEVNYFYGGNGSGKTTISKLIQNPLLFNKCKLEWKSSPLETLVYNKDFVNQNFSESNIIKGIFTLGKDSKDIKEFIDAKTEEIVNVDKLIGRYSGTLDDLNNQLENEKGIISEKCWSIKKKHDIHFKEAFVGNIKSKFHFLAKCLNEKDNDIELMKYEEILSTSKKIYNNELNTKELLNEFQFESLEKLEKDPILITKIVGKEDIDVGKLIKNLNNSDWIKQGREYLEKSEDKCPFCQQDILNDNLEIIFNQYFDETYGLQIKRIDKYYEQYSKYINNKIEEIISTLVVVADDDNKKELVSILQVIKEKYKSNIKLLDSKNKSPSIPVVLESLSVEFGQVKKVIQNYIDEIELNNNLVNNLEEEKEKLKECIWKFITNELNFDLKNYEAKKDGINKGISKISDSLKKTKIKK